MMSAWVKSRHVQRKTAYPLYPQKRILKTQLFLCEFFYRHYSVIAFGGE
jgi:hypothetical protein